MLKLIKYLPVAILVLLISCKNTSDKQSTHLANVGIIPKDESVDDSNFQPCHEDYSLFYYQVDNSDHLYKGEKPAIVKTFDDIKLPAIDQNDGYVTIRFLVNCKGETGRFRVEQVDFEYKDKEFEGELVTQLLEKTKQLDGWWPATREGYKCDYYKYLTFKIINNQTVDILP